jgi:hypothetical protein
MEHLNREAKTGIAGLGANITDHAVTRGGKALRETVPLLQGYIRVIENYIDSRSWGLNLWEVLMYSARSFCEYLTVFQMF